MEPVTRIDNSRGQATRRLIATYLSATDEELTYGLSWYVDAHTWAAELAAENTTYDLDVNAVAGITAALSPQTNWPLNQRKTVELLATGDTFGFTNGRDKAKAILAGADPLDVLRGPKERAFYSNIADPLGSTAVTIDRHAFDAAAGAVTDDRTRKVLDRKGEYERVADFYRSAARNLGVLPHVVQGVVWAVWRNRAGRFHYQRQGETIDTLRPDITEE